MLLRMDFKQDWVSSANLQNDFVVPALSLMREHHLYQMIIYWPVINPHACWYSRKFHQAGQEEIKIQISTNKRYAEEDTVINHAIGQPKNKKDTFTSLLRIACRLICLNAWTLSSVWKKPVRIVFGKWNSTVLNNTKIRAYEGKLSLFYRCDQLYHRKWPLDTSFCCQENLLIIVARLLKFWSDRLSHAIIIQWIKRSGRNKISKRLYAV